MSKKPSFIKNYIYNLFYQLLAIIVPIATTPYVSRVLGPTAFGDYSYSVAVVSYFGMVAVLGMVNYGQREVAFCQSDVKKRSAIFYEMVLLRLIMVAAALAAYIVLLAMKTRYQTLFLIQLLTVFSWAADISWFFQGIEDFKTTVIRNSLVKLASLALIFLFVRREGDLPIYALILSGTALAGNLTMWPFLKGKICPCSLSELRPLRHMRGSIELFIPVLSIQVYTVLDQTMLGALMDTTQVGYYAMTQKIIHLESSIIASLTAVLMPRMAALFAQKKTQQAALYYDKALTFGVMMNLPLTMGSMFLAGYLIPVFLGEGFLPSVRIMQVLSLIFITQGIGQIAGAALIAMGRQTRYTIAVTAGAVINFCCNLMLIPRFGAVGVAAASVFSEICVEAIMLWSVRPELSCAALFASLLRYALPTGAMCAVLALGCMLLPVSLISLAVLGVSAVAVYFAALYIARDELFRSLIRGRIAGVQDEENE